MGWWFLPLGVFAGWVAGAAVSRRIVRQEIARLEARLAGGAEKPAAVAATAVQAAPQVEAPETADEIAPETILILSAAVAAFLGKRARIRSARLVRGATSSAWAQQGRVFVQASHNLEVVHGR